MTEERWKEINQAKNTAQWWNAVNRFSGKKKSNVAEEISKAD